MRVIDHTERDGQTRTPNLKEVSLLVVVPLEQVLTALLLLNSNLQGLPLLRATM